MKFFKGDQTEIKMYNSASGVFDAISLALDQFFQLGYSSVPLGEFLFDEKRAPLVNAFRREIFIACFNQLFESWAFCGTFEAYLSVFRKIFGSSVDVVFTVPAPGKLNIDITASGFEESQFQARDIISSAYVFYDMITEDSDNLVFRNIAGLETESEVEKVLFTMVPTGIFTTVSLTIG